jgi:hypothetical protein
MEYYEEGNMRKYLQWNRWLPLLKNKEKFKNPKNVVNDLKNVCLKIPDKLIIHQEEK